MKAFFQKYKHAWVLLYAFLYLPWFFWLESRANLPYGRHCKNGLLPPDPDFDCSRKERIILILFT